MGRSLWLREQTDARAAIRTVVAWDRRAGVWLACACAREALRYVPAARDRACGVVGARPRERDAELMRLCGVMADAILVWPQAGAIEIGAPL